MIESILKFLPEWVMPVIFGALVWFGLNWLFIAPELGRRTVENSCPSERLAYCHCVAGYMISNARVPLSLWTSTLGFYQVDKSADIIAARQEGVSQCAKS
jgi:hypothetical protein